MKKMYLVVLIIMGMILHKVSWPMVGRFAQARAPIASVTDRFGKGFNRIMFGQRPALEQAGKGAFMPMTEQNLAYNEAVIAALEDVRTTGFIDPVTIQDINVLKNQGRVDAQVYENFLTLIEGLKEYRAYIEKIYQNSPLVNELQEYRDYKEQFDRNAPIGVGVASVLAGLGGAGYMLRTQQEEELLRQKLAKEYGVAPEHVLIQGYDTSGEPIVALSINARPAEVIDPGLEKVIEE